MKASENKCSRKQSIKCSKCLQDVSRVWKYSFFVPSPLLLLSRMSNEPLVLACFQSLLDVHVFMTDAKNSPWLEVNSYEGTPLNFESRVLESPWKVLELFPWESVRTLWLSSSLLCVHFIRPIPEWPQFSILLFTCKLTLVASFLDSKFKRIFSFKRGNKS